jgi:tetraacyldisaccharide 4'-kinase
MPGVVWGRFRNYLFDKGYLSQTYFDAFVISIGNLSWGGTGKTALTAQIASYFASEECRVAVISRGYGRRSRGFRLVSDGTRLLQNWRNSGDEPYLMAQQVPEAIVIVAEDRRDALPYLSKNPVDVVLLDDGFQHRKIARDLDIVLVDGSEHLTHQKVIPLGKLREPLESLKRADALVLTHSKIAKQDTMDWISSNITVPVFHADYVPVFTESPAVDESSLSYIGPLNPSFWSEKKLGAFCALGAPQHFFRMLKDYGAELVFTTNFRDHHPYTAEELQELQANAVISGAEALITTQKDAVKIDPSWLRLPLFVVDAELQLKEQESFFELIQDRMLTKSGRIVSM